MTSYTVVSGDNMWKIALNHGISLNELVAVNPQVSNSSLIFPGQKVNIPNTNKSIYKVKSGDNMWLIAKNYGIELNNLMAANPQITSSNLVFPGQIINIPIVTKDSDAPKDIRALETEVIRLVNVERAKTGKSALAENSEVSRIARIKSKDFINNNYFSHNSPTYGDPFDMLKSFGIKYTAAAENIANGQRTATEVMKTWMNSAGHRANILNSAYNQTGVGVARDNNGNLYWTQMFIRS